MYSSMIIHDLQHKVSHGWPRNQTNGHKFFPDLSNFPTLVQIIHEREKFFMNEK